MASDIQQQQRQEADRSLQAVLDVADHVAEEDNAVFGLLALARIVTRCLAYEGMLYTLGAEGSATKWQPTADWRRLCRTYDVTGRDGGSERIWLHWDAVIATPWRASRLVSTLSRLSAGPEARPGGNESWFYHANNHRITLWLPMRVAEVINGNHSIVAGVLSSTGSVPADMVYDLSPLYDKLQPTVDWWVERDTHINAERVDDWRLVALFEIGRRLNAVGFDGRLNTNEPSAQQLGPIQSWDRLRESIRRLPKHQAEPFAMELLQFAEEWETWLISES